VKIYISGPMTGLPEFNYPAFNAAAAALRASGLDVVNPAEKDLPLGLPWATYLRHDLVDLIGCEAIVMLPGWLDSKGACLERHVAEALGMPVYWLADLLRPAAGSEQD
jgi:hypothetical protein